ncbi:GumC family protein [Pelagibacterium luteolum]|uniref:non-specific protein-tyrosine kinase n=1 Tax=Pelagibacterium luteolum TaxID=440168 RepID=A0A1G7S275_9HYPH|nr:Wzz/FepE/Etk N-terminal domain-containing protein [Pelagibacterium luteolum]SDG17136.1 capsular exopolysaccharide family [Pelagibacterium luteolum]
MHNGEFDIRTALGTIRRQSWLILLVFVVTVGLAAVVALSLEPSYRATAVVMVDTAEKNLLDPTTPTVSAAADNSRMESEVAIVRSETNVDAVLQEAALLDDPDFFPREGLRRQIMILLGLAEPSQYTIVERQQDAARILRNSTSVQRQGLTYLLNISVNAPAPEKAAMIANTFAEVYIRNQVESKINRVMAGRDILFERVEDAREGLIDSEQAFSDFVLTSATTVAEATGRTDIEQLRLVLEASISERDRLTEQLELVQASLAASDWTVVADTLQSQSLIELRDRQAELEAELEANAQGSSPQAVQLRAELLALTEQLRTQANSELEILRQQIADQRARESDTQLQLRSSILTTNLPPEVLANMYELQQNAEIARTQYEQMLTRLRDIEAQAFLQVADSRVMSAAVPPSSSSFPNVPFIIFAAGLGGLVLGTGLAFGREHFIGSIVSADHLAAVTGTPVIATVPQRNSPGKAPDGSKRHSLSAIIVQDPYSSFAEAIRRIRVSIDQSTRQLRREPHSADVLLVSSANAQEGKTTMAVSLARAYAISGKSTLLIDADLRWPNVHKELGVPPSPALSHYLLSGKRNGFDQIMIADKLSPAKIIVGSDPAQREARAPISSEMLSNLIDSAITRFDVVIVDTPPVGALVDALYLAQYADTVLMIVKHGRTRQREIRAALHEIEPATKETASIFCALNGQPISRANNKRRFKNYYLD